MKSPLSISYTDLINMVERKLANMERFKASSIQQGKSEWTVNHEIACFKKLAKMLKKHQKNPQLNLNDIFDKL